MSDSNRPTILIIDNDEGVVRALETRLEGYGYRCFTAGTGAQGLSLFSEFDVDLVISDLNMPAGNGVELAQSIRKASDVPIILVTGFRDEFKRHLRGIKNVSVVQKPFNTSVLVDLVETNLTLAGCDLPVGDQGDS